MILYKLDIYMKKVESRSHSFTLTYGKNAGVMKELEKERAT